MGSDGAEVPTLDEIMAILGEHLPDLAARYHVKSLGVFGSYVRGQQRAGSDVDLLVEFDDPQVTLLEFVDLQNRLSDLLGVSVDLVERETLKPSLAEHILQRLPRCECITYLPRLSG